MEKNFAPGRADAVSDRLNKGGLHPAAVGHQGGNGSAAGDQDALDAAVDVFYRKMTEDAELAPFFAHIDMSKQRDRMSTFMVYILGGSEAYTGRDIYTVHKHMIERQGLRKQHFDAVLKHMHATLLELGASDDLVTHARGVIQQTLPQFRFPVDDGQQQQQEKVGQEERDHHSEQLQQGGRPPVQPLLLPPLPDAETPPDVKLATTSSSGRNMLQLAVWRVQAWCGMHGPHAAAGAAVRAVAVAGVAAQLAAVLGTGS